jgi:uncharacterized membrane protein
MQFPPSLKLRKHRFIILFILALVGFSDAAYLTAEHARGVVPPCSLVTGCETVLTSPYSSLGSIPVAALGVLFYGTLLVLLVAYYDSRSPFFAGSIALASIGGVVATLVFIYIQVVIIKAICLYCMISATTSLGIGIASVPLLRSMR